MSTWPIVVRHDGWYHLRQPRRGQKCMTESSSDVRLKTMMRQEESCDVDIAYLELKLAVGDVHSSGKGLYGIWHRQVFSPSGGWEVVSSGWQSRTM